ncbi:hypothetical protein BH24ACT20_BH24ACT20_00480 [soil metagenome]
MSCVRVLVAFDDEHRAFREVISEAIRVLRPELEVAVTEPAALGTEAPRLDPVLVVSGAPTSGPDDDLAWFELPTDPTLPATIRFGSRRTVCLNPGLLELLSAVDEARRLASTTSHPC